MQLKDQHIDEFIVLYEKHYGVVIDRDSALEKGIYLVKFDSENAQEVIKILKL